MTLFEIFIFMEKKEKKDWKEINVVLGDLGWWDYEG